MIKIVAHPYAQEEEEGRWSHRPYPTLHYHYLPSSSPSLPLQLCFPNRPEWQSGEETWVWLGSYGLDSYYSCCVQFPAVRVQFSIIIAFSSSCWSLSTADFVLGARGPAWVCSFCRAGARHVDDWFSSEVGLIVAVVVVVADSIGEGQEL